MYGWTPTNGAHADMLVDEEERGSFQVIILGGGGGPSEDNVTGILVRSVHARWAKNSILAVDAGVHLSAIINAIGHHMPYATRYAAPPTAGPQPQSIFTPVHLPASSKSENRRNSVKTFSPAVRPGEWVPSSPTLLVDPTSKLVLTTGPFKNILLPYETPKANAVQLLRSLISTYLITHPHLDHFSGFAINTASLPNTSRPKKVAALPPTIDAIKSHVFNDVIWPNMSDEEGGIGFVSYMRLIEGGNVALGEGEGRGYIEVCEGLEVKARGVSHGHSMKPVHLARGNHHAVDDPTGIDRRMSMSADYSSPDRRRASHPNIEYNARANTVPCVVDSTAFFIRAEATGDEILVFGDVEPDSVSMLPRNAKVWADAAPKIVSGLLKAIFIECSYTDAQTDETLFGHLAPRHLMAEMAVLAEHVEAVRMARPVSRSSRKASHGAGAGAGGDASSPRQKRKRQAESVDFGRTAPAARRGRGPTRGVSNGGNGGRETASLSPAPRDRRDDVEKEGREYPEDQSGRPMLRRKGSSHTEPLPWASGGGSSTTKPLQGLKVIIIHIKDQLSDAPSAGEVILKELKAHAYYEKLGLEFIVPMSGGYMYF